MTYLELRNNRKDLVLIKSINDEGTPFLSFSKPLSKPVNGNHLAKCKNTPCKYYDKKFISIFNDDWSVDAQVSFIEHEHYREQNKIVITYWSWCSNPAGMGNLRIQIKRSYLIKIIGWDVQAPFKLYYHACTIGRRLIFATLGRKCK